MSDVSSLGIATAFAAGVVSFLSPCVLPLVPGYIGYLGGESFAGQRHRAPAIATRLPAIALSAFFVLGFSTVFIALGASATLLGRLLLPYRHAASIVGGSIIIIFGLVSTGLLRLPALQRDFHFHPRLSTGTPLTAYLLGAAFGFGWTPCIGPVLGAILTVGAMSTAVSTGVALLSVYSLGLGIPFLISALFVQRLVSTQRQVKRFGWALNVLAGVTMIVTGVAIVTGRLSSFAVWMLDAFPALGRIG